jgi:hypothetical protein
MRSWCRTAPVLAIFWHPMNVLLLPLLRADCLSYPLPGGPGPLSAPSFMVASFPSGSMHTPVPLFITRIIWHSLFDCATCVLCTSVYWLTRTIWFLCEVLKSIQQVTTEYSRNKGANRSTTKDVFGKQQILENKCQNCQGKFWFLCRIGDTVFWPFKLKEIF